MTAIAAPELALTQLALELAVDQLTHPEGDEIEVAGEMVRTSLPPLLEQIADAVDSDQREIGAFTPTSKPPVALDALGLLDEIDRTTQRVRGTRIDQVRAWSAACHSLTGLDELDAARRAAEGWVARARSILDPAPPRVLRGKRCPQCLATSVPGTDAAGETVRRSPLEIDPFTGGARCVGPGCGARWNVDQLALLADQIDRADEQVCRQTETETLAVEDA